MATQTYSPFLAFSKIANKVRHKGDDQFCQPLSTRVLAEKLAPTLGGKFNLISFKDVLR